MVRDYELMYIIRPELDDEAVQASMAGVGALIESCGGEVTKVAPWGKRRLAFEVAHLRDGYYVLTKLKLDGERVTDLERTLRISDTVFRHLLVLDEGTPDDESGVPGRPSREPRREAIPDIPAHVPKALIDDDGDDHDDDHDDDDGDDGDVDDAEVTASAIDDEGGAGAEAATAQPAGVAAAGNDSDNDEENT